MINVNKLPEFQTVNYYGHDIDPSQLKLATAHRKTYIKMFKEFKKIILSMKDSHDRCIVLRALDSIEAYIYSIDYSEGYLNNGFFSDLKECLDRRGYTMVWITDDEGKASIILNMI